MKSYLAKSVCLCLGIICCAASSHAAGPKKSDAPAQSSDAGGTLKIKRSASVGSGVTADVSLDGKPIVTLSNGRSYKGPVSAGKHVLTVTPDPNTNGHASNKTEFTADKGGVYSFTVGSKNGDIFLTKNT